MGVSPREWHAGDAIARLQQEAEGVVIHKHTPGEVAAQQTQIFHVLSNGPAGGTGGREGEDDGRGRLVKITGLVIFEKSLAIHDSTHPVKYKS